MYLYFEKGATEIATEKLPMKLNEKNYSAFTVIKNLLKSSNVIMLFNEKLLIILTCDVSPKGVSSVLSPLFPESQ